MTKSILLKLTDMYNCWHNTNSLLAMVVTDYSAAVIACKKLHNKLQIVSNAHMQEIITAENDSLSVYQRKLKSVKTILRQVKPITKKVITTLEHSKVLTKILTIESSLSDHEIMQQVNAHAEQSLHCSIDEINIDFERLNVSQSSSSLIDVRWVAARRDDVKAITEFYAEVGLEVCSIDIDFFAWKRTVNFYLQQNKNTLEQQELTVFLNFSAESIQIYICSQGQGVYSHEEIFPGYVSLANIKLWLNNFADYISENFAVELTSGKAASIYLSGAVNDKALISEIQARTNINTQVINPVVAESSDFKITISGNKLTNNHYLTCFGLLI